MNSAPTCPRCHTDNNYQDGSLWVCLECGNEWELSASEAVGVDVEAVSVVHDANGNVLESGDAVTVIKDLKVKGSATGIKAGTKVKNITLIEGHDGHNISCKVEGIGAMYLKSELVKKY